MKLFTMAQVISYISLYLHKSSSGCNMLAVFCLCQIIPSQKLRWLQRAGSILSVSNYTFTKAQLVVMCWQYFVCVKLYLHKSSGGCNVLAVFCLCQIIPSQKLRWLQRAGSILSVSNYTFTKAQVVVTCWQYFVCVKLYLHKSSGGCNVLAVFCLCQIIPSQKLRWL